MLDLRLLKDDPQKIREALKKKCVVVDFEEIIKLDDKRRALTQEVDSLRAEQNNFSAEIAKLSDQDKEKKLDDMKAVAQNLSEKEKQLKEIGTKFQELWLQIPNIPADDVPEGSSDIDNKPLREEGEKPKFDFEPKGHEEIIKNLDLVDFERAAKVSGSKFYYLKNKAVILEMALMRFALDLLIEAGFTPLTTPDLVRPELMYEAAHFPPEDDAYAIERDNLYLAGTAEIGLAGYHRGETINNSKLPMRYCGYSACFRREAGSYGKKGSGLYRVHQFQKIEMFVWSHPEDSEKEHQKLLSISEDLMKKLELPYRVVFNCGGDLGLPQYKKYDIEAWLPSTGDWGETHSCSNDTDYQARRLGTKFLLSENKKEYVHTLNNTAIASPRIIIPLLEIHQQKDGSVKIPEALRKYTGFDSLTHNS